MNINKALVCGRITKDPELRTTPKGTSVIAFSVATNFKIKDKESTEFHNIVAWGKLAEIIEKYCSKGDEIYIEGRIQTRSWESEGSKKYRTEIIAEGMQFGQKKKGSEVGNKKVSHQTEDVQDLEGTDHISVEDIPF